MGTELPGHVLWAPGAPECGWPPPPATRLQGADHFGLGPLAAQRRRGRRRGPRGFLPGEGCRACTPAASRRCATRAWSSPPPGPPARRCLATTCSRSR
eukprot:2890738-Pyramimonas_sp.AAC.1